MKNKSVIIAELCARDFWPDFAKCHALKFGPKVEEKWFIRRLTAEIFSCWVFLSLSLFLISGAGNVQRNASFRSTELMAACLKFYSANYEAGMSRRCANYVRRCVSEKREREREREIERAKKNPETRRLFCNYFICHRLLILRNAVKRLQQQQQK